jgi:hypothetical protein
MNRGCLVYLRFFKRRSKGILHRALVHRLAGLLQRNVILAFRGKHPNRIAMHLPVFPQQLKRALGQRDVAIFPALAVTHVQHPARAVDVSHLNVRAFLQSEPAGVNRGEAYSIPRQSHSREDRQHFFDAEDHREFPFVRRPDQLKGSELFSKGFLEEKLDPAESDG